MGQEKRSKQKILIADDSEMNRSILTDMLGNEFEVLEAENGVQAVAILQKRHTEIALVLLDIVMPEMDGFDVLMAMNKNHWIEDVPVIMISAENVPAYVERAFDLGVTDYIGRPFDARIVRRRAVNTLMLYAKQKRLIGMVADQIYEKEKRSSLMIEILSHIVEFRNGESGLHVLHIHTMTELLLNHLVHKTDKYRLSRADISLISNASALHDIGKIAVPEAILNKPGRLTPEEFAVIKTHCAEGAAMLERLPLRQHEPLVKVAYEICRWHHERYDGKGYPDGLAGDEIPISAQIVALADVYDALTSQRVYKEAYSHDKAMRMILGGECGAFNPLLLECLAEMGESIRSEIGLEPPGSDMRWQMRSLAEELLRQEDLSVSERTLQLLEHERAKYQFFASMSNELQFEYTAEPSMLMVSTRGAAQLGINEITVDPLHDEAILALVDRQTLDAMRSALHASTLEHPVVQHKCRVRIDGQPRWCRLIARAMWSADEPPRYTGSIGKLMDIHEEYSRMTDLEHLATHDSLTGLLNHKSARERIEKIMAQHPQQQFALLMVDLDYFKDVNDEHGHLFGDDVLQYLAAMLRENIRSTDIAARVGGDEFLVFTGYSAGVEQMAKRIIASLDAAHKGVLISVSMGIAVSSADEPGYASLFHRADQALYAAKRMGRKKYCFYDASMRDMLSAISPIDA